MILKPGAPPQVRETEVGLCFTCTLPAAAGPRWAWLADTHIAADNSAEHAGCRPAKQLSRIVGEILAARACGALVNGDLSWSQGQPADYRRFDALVRPLWSVMPLLLGIGNHDRRDVLLSILAATRHCVPERLLSITDQPPYRFVMLDSQRSPGEVGGELGATQLQWLGGLLRAEPFLRTLLFVHHPGESSSKGCRDFDSLSALAQRCRNVQAIVTGHEHSFSLAWAGDVPLVGLPAAGFPFTPQVPCGWIEARLSSEGMVLLLHDANGVAHIRLGWRQP